MSEENQTSREWVNYEYLTLSTPKYLAEPIREDWELYQVSQIYLPNGHPNFVLVFRRPWIIKEEKQS